jgi:hypothetical protein
MIGATWQSFLSGRLGQGSQCKFSFHHLLSAQPARSFTIGEILFRPDLLSWSCLNTTAHDQGLKTQFYTLVLRETLGVTFRFCRSRPALES